MIKSPIPAFFCVIVHWDESAKISNWPKCPILQL